MTFIILNGVTILGIFFSGLLGASDRKINWNPEREFFGSETLWGQAISAESSSFPIGPVEVLVETPLQGWDAHLGNSGNVVGGSCQPHSRHTDEARAAIGSSKKARHQGMGAGPWAQCVHHGRDCLYWLDLNIYRSVVPDATQAGKSADRMQTQVFQLHHIPPLLVIFWIMSVQIRFVKIIPFFTFIPESGKEQSENSKTFQVVDSSISPPPPF